MKDLFGNEITPEQATAPTKRDPRPDRAHPAPPGTGPKAETCGSCRHYRRVHYHTRHFLKCSLRQADWTHGPGTDIRKRDAACRFWERNQPHGI